MMRQKLTIGLAAAAFTLSLAPVWAQERERPSQGEPSRPSNGETVGSAVPRGGGDGGASASSASGPASSSSSSGSSSSSASPTTWIGNSSIHERAPIRPGGMDRADRADRAEQRRGNGSGTTGRAVPRGESGGRTAGSDGSTSGGSTSASSGSESQPSQGRSRAVPTYSRPRDGRNPVGSAVERTSPLPDRNGRRGYYYDPYGSFYYDPYYSGRYSYWSPFGYGYGLGYFSYDPFLFSGFGYPGYYGSGGLYDPYYGGYGGGGGGYSSRYGQAYREVGSLRLKVKPANAQVYIDGYFVGVIDSYDGALQRLSVESGPHRVELKAEGYEPVQFEVMITPGETVTYKGEMKHR